MRHSAIPLILVLLAVACMVPPTPVPPAVDTPAATVRASPAVATDSPEALDTPTTSPKISAVVEAQGLNVRAGPGVAYARLGAVAGGTEIALEARNDSETWVRGQIQGAELEGWLSAAYLDVDGDVATLPLGEFDPPPEVTERPVEDATPASVQVSGDVTPSPQEELDPPPEVTERPAEDATPTSVSVEAVPRGLTWVVTGKRVTAMYRDASGTIYFAGPKNTQGIADPFHAEAAVWKKPVGGEPIQLTPYSYNAIGGLVVHNGFIYFNEAGSLRRMPDDNQRHEAEVVLSFPNLSDIYMHINHALAKHTVNGEDVLLMAVGSRLDSNYDAPGHHSGIQPPYYEEFPTGRILYARLAWLETASNFVVRQATPGQISEFARGFRNPWSIAAGPIGGRTRILAVDNDPTLTPEKYDNDPQNAGDEVTEVLRGAHHGHPFYYAGREPEPDYVKPIAVLPDGSVPSGVAIAAGKLFVAVHSGAMIVKVDPAGQSWTPVLTDIQPFNLSGYGNLLYILDWSGIRVIDATQL